MANEFDMFSCAHLLVKNSVHNFILDVIKADTTLAAAALSLLHAHKASMPKNRWVALLVDVISRCTMCVFVPILLEFWF